MRLTVSNIGSNLFFSTASASFNALAPCFAASARTMDLTLFAVISGLGPNCSTIAILCDICSIWPNSVSMTFPSLYLACIFNQFSPLKCKNL